MSAPGPKPNRPDRRTPANPDTRSVPAARPAPADQAKAVPIVCSAKISDRWTSSNNVRPNRRAEGAPIPGGVFSRPLRIGVMQVPAGHPLRLANITPSYDPGMNTIVVRQGAPEDGPFLAVAIQEADRGHTGVGTWDILFPGSEQTRLRAIAQITSTARVSYLHWSSFLVAEVDGIAAGTVAGYVPDLMTQETFAAACREALGTQAERVLETKGARSVDYFRVQEPGDTLKVEWVYTGPRFRGRGVSSALLARLLRGARDDGGRTAHVATYIGNQAALAAYRRAGFEAYAECRHADYELRFNAPGLVYLRQALG